MSGAKMVQDIKKDEAVLCLTGCENLIEFSIAAGEVCVEVDLCCPSVVNHCPIIVTAGTF